eukprot:362554-Chlamydomonas_euryale.AAC.1
MRNPAPCSGLPGRMRPLSSSLIHSLLSCTAHTLIHSLLSCTAHTLIHSLLSCTAHVSHTRSAGPHTCRYKAAAQRPYSPHLNPSAPPHISHTPTLAAAVHAPRGLGQFPPCPCR